MGLVVVFLLAAFVQFSDRNTRVQAADEDFLTVDVACDCRTATSTFFEGNRGDTFMVQGKIFPEGTLPAGTAANDPTEAVGGASPIGIWICRGQLSGTLPEAIAAAYASSPFVYNTQYYILDDGRAITLEGYESMTSTGEVTAGLSVTGGVGGLRGAAGHVTFPPGGILGTNATGCPNFRTKVSLLPGSTRGSLNR